MHLPRRNDLKYVTKINGHGYVTSEDVLVEFTS